MHKDSTSENSSQLSQTNKLVIALVSIIASLVVIGNIISKIQANYTVIPTMIFGVLCLAFIGYLIFINKNTPDSTKIKYQGYVGFFIIYSIHLFIDNRILVFVYIIPIIYMYMLYYDVKMMKFIVSSVFFVNIARIVFFIITNKVSDREEILDCVILTGTLAIVAVNAVVATIMANKFNNATIKTIKDSHDKQEQILKQVLDIGNILDTKSNEAYKIVSELENSSNIMNKNMIAMKKDISDTMTNINEQSALTESIHSTIDETASTSKRLQTISNSTLDKMSNGLNIVKELNKEKLIISKNSVLVHTSMNALQEKTSEISKIIDTITSIANQTNILSLNASIESARAGESGKGFSVVANEVGSLAAETSESVSNISNIIIELQQMVKECVDAIKEFESATAKQDILIQNTETIFKETAENMNTIGASVTDVTEKIQYILSSNNEIVKSIQLLLKSNDSTKESIDETSSATEKTINEINETKNIAQELLNTSNNLKKYI